MSNHPDDHDNPHHPDDPHDPDNPDNPNNPMKKRFRSWHFPEEHDQLSQPRRRRRYPRLVFRDRTGNHIANDIATAPKVELPLKPIVPRSVTFPTSSVSQPDPEMFEEVPKEQSTPFRSVVDSPPYSASTIPGTRHMDSQPSMRSPSTPLHAKPTANKVESTIVRSPVGDPNYHSREHFIRPEQTVRPPVPAARVNPVPMHVQPDEYPSPQYTPRQRNTASGFSPYHASSCSPTPPTPQGASRISTGQRAAQYTTQPAGLRPPHQSGQYVTQAAGHRSPQQPGQYGTRAVGHRAPQQSGQYETHVVHNAPQKRNVYQSPPHESGALRTVPPSQPPQQTAGSYPPGNVPAAERIILAGKRCGTVQYWRSSLQMPREKGVVKSVKAVAPQAKRRVKQATPEQTMSQSAHQPTQPHSTSGPPCLSSAYGYANAQQRSTHPDDCRVRNPARVDMSPGRAEVNPGRAEVSPGRAELSPGHAELNPGLAEVSPGRGEVEIGHEYWRTATKLPRTSGESSRVKRLQQGRRRMDGSNVGYMGNGRASHPTNGTMVTGSPVSGLRYGGAQVGPVNAGMQSGYVQQTQAATQAGQYAGPGVTSARVEMVSDQPIARRRRRYGQQDIVIRSKEEIEQRRLLFLRDFEMRRLRTLAQSKFHVKMNLRGRMKLEQWVNTDPVTIAASNLIVTMFNLDRRVLSKNDDVRRNALYDMTNEDLRILEALMSRISSRGGRTNWSMLTTSLSYERFVSTLPARD